MCLYKKKVNITLIITTETESNDKLLESNSKIVKKNKKSQKKDDKEEKSGGAYQHALPVLRQNYTYTLSTLIEYLIFLFK